MRACEVAHIVIAEYEAGSICLVINMPLWCVITTLDMVPAAFSAAILYSYFSAFSSRSWRA
jgi:hypothetical protein